MFGYYLRETISGENKCELRNVETGMVLREITPERSREIFTHSKKGFSWGSNNPGSSQLALAILFDFTNEETIAIKYYKAFRELFLSSAENTEIILDSVVNDFLNTIATKEGKPLIPKIGKDK